MAASYGFDYVPADMLLQRGFEENLPRLQKIAENPKSPAPMHVTEALLGAVPVAYPPLTQVLKEFFELSKIKHLRK